MSLNCPYCKDGVVDNSAVFSYFMTRDNELEKLHKEFDDEFKEDLKAFTEKIIIKHGSINSAYTEFWLHYVGENSSLVSRGSGANGVIISSYVVIKELITICDRPNKSPSSTIKNKIKAINEDKNKSNTPQEKQAPVIQKFLDQIESDFSGNRKDGMKLLEDIDKVLKEINIGVYLLIDNRKKPDDDIIWYVSLGTRNKGDNYIEFNNLKVTALKINNILLSPSALACPSCWNFLPFEYLNNKSVKITFMGNSTIGKTVYAMSLMGNSCRNFIGSTNGNETTIDVSFINCAYDTIQTAFNEQLIDFLIMYNSSAGSDESNKFPETTLYPMPCLFFKIRLKRPGFADFDFVLCLTDTMGEKINKKAINGQQDLNYFSPQFDKNDGFMFFYDGELPKPSNTGNAVETVNTGADKVFSMLEHTNSELFNSKPFAYVLTKFDIHLNNQKKDPNQEEFREIQCLLYGCDSEKRKKFYDPQVSLLHSIMANRFTNKLYKNDTLCRNTFKVSRWFAVASINVEYSSLVSNNSSLYKIRKGSDNRCRCINVHEPIVWLLSEILKNKYGNELGLPQEPAENNQ